MGMVASTAVARRPVSPLIPLITKAVGVTPFIAHPMGAWLGGPDADAGTKGDGSAVDCGVGAKNNEYKSPAIVDTPDDE